MVRKPHHPGEPRCAFGWMTFIVVMALLCSSAGTVSARAEEPQIFGRPVAIVMSDDGDSALIANRDLAAITVVDSHTLEVRLIEGRWSGIVDAALMPKSKFLIAVATVPPSLLSINTVPQSVVEPATVALPALPARVAVSLDGGFACVSMTWDHSVCMVPLTIDGRPDGDAVTRIPLSFPPKELLALPDQRFLVADAFGSHLVVVDASSGSIVAAHELSGHHIGGMTRRISGGQILITHQRLSKVAESSRDDIHWGTLMQNGVASIPEADFFDTTQPISRNMRFRSLGDVGGGAGDPAGIVAWDKGHFAVAVAGTNQIAWWNSTAKELRFVDAGLLPTRLVHLGPSKLLCVNTLDDTASLVDFSKGLRVEKVLGKQRTLETPEDRGEAAFYAAKLSHDGWMSCSSCHVDGHSPDLLADTMGDGRFGNPKRIPSLLNSSVTGPWAWDGSKTSLEAQVRQTLESTMHRDERSRTSGASDDDVARDIAAYLQTLSTPSPVPVSTAEETALGTAIFRERACNKCHDPDNDFTSPQTYDVAVHDEAGTKLFNPPSLKGLRHRRAFFHDARFRSIDELLETHPDPKASASVEEQSRLKAFLLSL